MSPGRPNERYWLRDVTVVLVLFALSLAGQRWLRGQPPAAPREAGALVLLLASLYFVHALLAGQRLRADQRVLPLVGLLGGLGLLLNLRLSPADEPWSMVRWLLGPLGALTLILGLGLTRQALRRDGDWGWLAGPAALGVLWAVLLRGMSFRGAQYGPGLTTPTELLKPLIVVFLAWFLSRPRTSLVASALVVGVGLGLLVGLVRQGDLGMLMILGGLGLSLMFLRTAQSRWLMMGLGAGALVAMVLMFGGTELLPNVAHKAQVRVQAWLNPWADIDGYGYQTAQALFAAHAGGLDGAGLGAGQAELVPLVRSDFIWAALCEELGLLGCALLLLAYWGLFARGARIATRASSGFGQALATGCVTVLVVQTLLNIGGVVRLCPVTGITLPFVSQGGSSWLVCFMLIGMLLAVDHEEPAAGWAGGEQERVS
ncbi:MAG TPA: hypothetical protein DCZ72_07045 [Armatimonadetes bacterium]|nr:hypothetical protein [Armatimonadota bacterium]